MEKTAVFANMNMRHEEKQGCGVLYLESKIDIFHVEKLRTELFAILEKTGYKRVVLNFSGVRFLNSSGLALLIKLQHTFAGKVEFRFCCLRENIKKLFRSTSLFNHFDIDETEEDSIARFQEDME